jgi:hypothetical protein
VKNVAGRVNIDIKFLKGRIKMKTILTLIVLFCILVSPSIATIVWDGSSSVNWGTAANWDLNRVPLSTDALRVNDTTPNIYLDVDGVAAGDSRIGNATDCDSYLVIESENLDIYGNFYVGMSGRGYIDISGGQLNVDSALYMSRYAASDGSEIDQTDGIVDVNTTLYVGYSGSNAQYKLHGGTLYVGGLSIAEDANCNLDIDGAGALRLDGDCSSQITAMYTDGQLTAEGGSGSLVVCTDQDYTYVSNSSLLYNTWTGDSSTNWSSMLNWSRGRVPFSTDMLRINDTDPNVYLDVDGTGAGGSKIGNATDCDSYLIIDEHALDIYGHFYVGMSGRGYIDMSGGYLTVDDSLYMGRYVASTDSEIDQTAGVVDVGSTLYVGYSGSNAQYNLHGGTLYASALSIASSANCNMDITNGAMQLDGNVSSQISTMCGDGRLTADGGSGSITVSADNGYTYVSASSWPSYVTWDRSDSNDWGDTANWDANRVPFSIDVLRINDTSPYIYLNVDAQAEDGSRIGNTTDCDSYITIDGRSLHIYGIFYVGMSGRGYIDISDGQLTVDSALYMSRYAASDGSEIDQAGGAVDVDTTLYVGYSGSNAQYNLHGGTLYAGNLSIAQDANCHLDITRGTMRLEGDERNSVYTMHDDGRITAYGGHGNISATYDGTYTYVNATRIVGFCMGGWKDQYINASCIIFANLSLYSNGDLQDFTTNEIANLTSLVASAHENGTKVLISMGGADAGVAFAAMAANSTYRANFIDNVVDIVEEYDLDGVDIDWEAPNSQTDATNHNTLMGELYDEFHPDDKLVTTALGSNSWNLQYIPTALFDNVDWINIMTYGTTHEELLYSFMIDGLDRWFDKGLSPEKAVLGVPFYGRHDVNDDPLTYNDIIDLDPNAQYKDLVEGYVYNGHRTLRRKTRWALDNGCGIMIWHIGQDDTDANTSLLVALTDEIKLQGTELYATQFDFDDVLDDWSGKSGWQSYWSLDLGLGDGQLTTTDGTQNTSVWYDVNLPDGNSPYDLEDYIVTAEYDANSAATAVQLLARVTDASNWYSCKYNPTSDLLIVQKCVSGSSSTVSYASVPGTTPSIYKIVFELSGNSINAKMIDAVYGTVLASIQTSDSALSKGTAGFRVYNTTAYINNFSIASKD